MLHQSPSALPDPIATAVEACAAVLKTWPTGRRAISVGGSIGKGVFDHRSDIDLRLWHELDLPAPHRDPDLWKPLFELIESWKTRGVTIDGVWPRKIGDVEAALKRWAAGEARPDEQIWCVWGYHLPVDVANQYVLDDPDGILAGWKALLTPYPPALRRATLRRHLASLRYWRGDYHYASKVDRADAVFLASLTSRLVHDVMQVLFALNEEHYVGDGSNLTFADRLPIKPAHLIDRVSEVLYPGTPDRGRAVRRQADVLAALIDDVVALADADERAAR